MPTEIKIEKTEDSGFTLIELLVVISIMVLLTSTVIANFSGLSQGRNVVSARDTLVSQLRRAQSASLSSKDSTNGRPSSAYGVILSLSTPTTYSVFVEDNANPLVRTTLETVTLPSKIVLNRIQVVNSSGVTATPNSLTIYFTVPYARALQSYGSSNKEKDSTTTITLASQDGTVSKNIIINGISGNISAP